MKKLPVIGVMGSSSTPNDDLAAPLGRLLASLPVHLLTGAGQATMAAVSQAFAEVDGRAGLCIGVVPAATLNDPAETRPGYPNDWVELPIFTHLLAEQPDAWDGLTRNHINILTSDVVIALPGNAGTTHEIELAVRYAKPVVAFFHHHNEMAPIADGVRVCTEIADVEAFVRERLNLDVG